MALQTLPVELFLLIVDELESDADKQCLRLTCSAFKDLIPKFGVPVTVMEQKYGRPLYPPFYVSPEIHDRRDFLSRLSLPGNIFAKDSLLACKGCLRVLDKATCSESDSAKVDDLVICEKCHYNITNKTIPAGHKLTWDNGSEMRKCDDCEVSLGMVGSEIHLVKLGALDWYICTGCVEYLSETA